MRSGREFLMEPKRKSAIAILLRVLVVCIVLVIVLTTVIIPKNKRYNAAVDLYNAGKYEEAISAFKALNGYRDSAAQITKCRTAIKENQYNAALELYNEGKYEEALTAFKALLGYRDSIEQIDRCETAIKDGKYALALSDYEAEDYDAAIEAFKALSGYKDSDLQLEKCYIAKYGEERYYFVKDIQVGDSYTFGTYEQDNDLANGKEDIEWVVLEKDGMSLLLISKYALDTQPYCTFFGNITWENCSLRQWLNGSFLDAAFSTEEQNKLKSVTVTADKNPSYDTPVGNDTIDRVFLLSILEANRYFPLDRVRHCKATEYCYAQGAYRAENDNCWWWLRTQGINSNYAANVYDPGSVNYLGYDILGELEAVRPALWIDLGK